MIFEWDENKNVKNKKKHHISFYEARDVFANEDTIISDDIKHSDKEKRFIAIGRSFQKNVLLVVFCIRYKDTIRIISARKATKKERRKFYDNQK